MISNGEHGCRNLFICLLASFVQATGSVRVEKQSQGCRAPIFFLPVRIKQMLRGSRANSSGSDKLVTVRQLGQSVYGATIPVVAF